MAITVTDVENLKAGMTVSFDYDGDHFEGPLKGNNCDPDSAELWLYKESATRWDTDREGLSGVGVRIFNEIRQTYEKQALIENLEICEPDQENTKPAQNKMAVDRFISADDFFSAALQDIRDLSNNTELPDDIRTEAGAVYIEVTKIRTKLADTYSKYHALSDAKLPDMSNATTGKMYWFFTQAGYPQVAYMSSCQGDDEPWGVFGVTEPGKIHWMTADAFSNIEGIFPLRPCEPVGE